jgi:DNA polymerase I
VTTALEIYREGSPLDRPDLNHVKLNRITGFESVLRFNDWLTEGPLQHGVMAVDTEGTGLSRFTDRVRLVQVGDSEQGWSIPWDRWSGLFVDAINRFRGSILMFNSPYDHSMLAAMGVRLDWSTIMDVLPMLKLLEPHKRNGLKPASGRHVDPFAASAQKELDDAIKKFGWDGVNENFPPYWQYAALDPVLTTLLCLKLGPKIMAGGPRLIEAYDVENAVLSVLSAMTDKGIPVNVPFAQEQRAKITAYSAQTADYIKRKYGVSPGSNLKVIEKLQSFGYEFTKATESGAYSLDKEVLEDIDHELAQLVLKRRQLDKIGSTYLDHYINKNRDGRVHPSINSSGAITGRMSVSDPNFQNLPRIGQAKSAATVVRACVEFSEGSVGLFCDFAQIETRLLAHLSQDAGLIDAFHQPEDFFVTLARNVFSDPTIDKKSPLRNVIKTWVYATIYGAGLEKQAKTAGMSMIEMQQVVRRIHAAYPGIQRFQNEVQLVGKANQRETGESFYICPMSGRKHVAERGKEYALVNYLIQGMAAFFFKKKLLELDAAGLGEYMILPVHDEIILELPVSQAPWAADILMKIMNDDTTFTVPVKAEVSYGFRWSEKRDWSTWNS